MKNIFKFIALLSLVVTASGCANRATGTVDKSTDLSLFKVMYVQKLPADGRGVNEIIASKLRTKGITVTTGAGRPPGNVDAVVSYIDRWMWDITMYMLELTINIQDSKTGHAIATANSMHTSLTRKSPNDMVDETINNIYKNVPTSKMTTSVMPHPAAGSVNALAHPER